MKKAMRIVRQIAKDVPDAADRVQHAGLSAGLGLAAQVADVDVQRVRARAEVEAPDAREEKLAGQHLLGVAQEELQQAELGRRQLERARAASRLARRRVEHEVAVAQRAAAVRLAAPADA